MKLQYLRRKVPTLVVVSLILAAGSAPISAAAQSTDTSPTVTVCDDETLNLLDGSGKPLSEESLEMAKQAVQYICDSRDVVRTMASGRYVTNTTKSEKRDCSCGAYQSWWSKVTAVGLPSGAKTLDVIYRIGPGGSGAWTGGPVQHIASSDTSAALPLLSGTMKMGEYVETVGTLTRNQKIVEQIRASAG